MAKYKRHKDPPVDVVVDLETMGKSFYSPIVQIGWSSLGFAATGQLNIRYTTASLGPFRIDLDTVRWWMKQKDAAKAGVYGAGWAGLGALANHIQDLKGSHQALVSHPNTDQLMDQLWSDGSMNFLDPFTALARFSEALRALGDNVHIWTHVGFDYGLLKYAYEAAKMAAPWGYYHVHDLRTLDALSGRVDLPREGTYHTAKDDAIHQARNMETQLAIMGFTSPRQLHADWRDMKPTLPEEAQDRSVELMRAATYLARYAHGDDRPGALTPDQVLDCVARAKLLLADLEEKLAPSADLFTTTSGGADGQGDTSPE